MPNLIFELFRNFFTPKLSDLGTENMIDEGPLNLDMISTPKLVHSIFPYKQENKRKKIVKAPSWYSSVKTIKTS